MLRTFASVKVAVVLIVVVAVGVSSGISGASSPSGRQPTGEPLKFGLITSDTGPFSALAVQGDGIEAYVDAWNERGGYKNHPIQIVRRDGGSSPSEANTVARQLVEEENVLGFVSNYNIFDCPGNKKYFASVPVAVIDQSVQTTCYDPKVDFTTFRLGGTQNISVMVKWAVDQGAKKIGFVGLTIPGFDEMIDKGKRYAESLGASMIVKLTPGFTPTAADVDQALVPLKEAGVDTIIPVFQSEFLPVVMREAELQGIGPKDIPRFLGAAFDPANKELLAAQDQAYGVSFTLNYGDNTAATRKAKKVLKGHVPANSSGLGFAFKGYNGAALLEQALDRVKGPVTRASLIKALKTMTDVSVPLAHGHFDLTDAPNNPETGEAYQIVDGKYVLTTKSIIVKDIPE